jgi:Tfp pilus assembly protein PilO
MQKSIIIAAVIFVAIVLGIIFFGWPKYQEFGALRAEIRKSQLELANKEEYFSQLRDISLKLKGYEAEFSKIDNSLTASSTEPELVNFISNKVSQSGLILGNISLSGASSIGSDSRLKRTSIGLTAVGFYPALKNLLLSFQKSAKIIEVDSISFSAPGEGEAFSFGLTMQTYSY